MLYLGNSCRTASILYQISYFWECFCTEKLRRGALTSAVAHDTCIELHVIRLITHDFNIRKYTMKIDTFFAHGRFQIPKFLKISRRFYQWPIRFHVCCSNFWDNFNHICNWHNSVLKDWNPGGGLIWTFWDFSQPVPISDAYECIRPFPADDCKTKV